MEQSGGRHKKDTVDSAIKLLIKQKKTAGAALKNLTFYVL
jgi:hypothetical protein